jgi:hypothetical protein
MPQLSGFVVNDDGDLFLWRLLDAKDKVFKLHGSDGRQHLSTPEWIIGSGQLLADGDGKDGGNHDGGGG